MSETKKLKTSLKKDETFKIIRLTILICLIVSIFLIVFFSAFTIKGNAISQDVNYTFDNDFLYDSDNFSYNTFNTRNQTIITKSNFFNASYSFTGETGLIDTEISIIDGIVSGVKGNVSVNSSLLEHNEILNLTVEGSGDDAGGYDSIDIPIGFGTIEFWILTSDATYDSHIISYDGAIIGFQIRIDADKIAYYDGANHDITDAYDNTWYHIRIDFECTDGGYLGLPNDDFYITINGKRYGNYNFRNPLTELDKLQFYIIDAQSYSTYFDGIGYSWFDNYTIGQNFVYPESSITNIQEIDKCEFAYNITTLEPNTLDSEIINNNWIENDDGTDVHVKTSGLYDEIDIDYGLTQDQNDYGIYKEFSYNLENIFNISINITSMDLFNPHLDGWYFNIYTYDDTLLVSLLFNLTVPPDISLYYYDGTDYIFIHEIITLWDFSFNIYIDNIVILRLDDNDVIYSWFFPEITNKIGINTIEIIGGHKDDIGDYASLTINSIGLYINGSSYLPDDLSSIIIDTDIEYWIDSFYDIIEINGNGNFSIALYYGGSFVDMLIPFSIFNNEIKFFHYIDGNIFSGTNIYQFVCLTNGSFDISSISVSGTILTEGSNTYFPSFDYKYVDTEINFFYVKSNTLYFYLDLNESSYEGIKATFTIPEVSTINGTIEFYNFYSGHIAPYLCLNYTYSEVNYYQLKYYANHIKYILPQNQWITQIIINVSDYIVNQDNYTNHNSGFISGYIRSIEFGFIPNIDYVITSITLINGFIPLIIILVPTIALFSRLGKKIILPSMILMSFICFLSQLIPLWLFSTLIIIIGYLILIERKEL